MREKRRVALIVVMILFLTLIILFILKQQGILTRSKYTNANNQKDNEITNSNSENKLPIIQTIEEAKTDNILSITDNTEVKDDEGNTVTIPAGFKVASDSATKQEDGVVVEDKDGNQFVWIPVANISDYKRIDFGSKFDIGDYKDYLETMPGDEQASVNTYHGYYIGRYEAGDSVSTANKSIRVKTTSTTNKVSVKKLQEPYNWITKDQADTLATGMKTAEGYKGTTKLCSGYSWDTALNFIQNTIPDYATNSKQGNYYNTTFTYANIFGVNQTKEMNKKILIPTGETTPVCNIYDMGGNEEEWTTEMCKYENGTCVLRGGSFSAYYLDKKYESIPAGHRDAVPHDFSQDNLGFRVTLYM